MAKPRPKIAVAPMLLESDVAFQRVLKEFGYTPAGETPMGAVEYTYGDSAVFYDSQGWTATKNGKEVDFGSTDKDLKQFLSAQHGEPTQSYPEGYVPPMSMDDKARLRGLGVIGKLVAQKNAGRPGRFSFAVPSDAADKVAFHLAQAGMEDFKVNDDMMEATFTFQTEPEMQVAEDLVKETFADQIARQKNWKSWAPTPQDPSRMEEIDTQQKPMMSSAKTAEEPYDTLEQEGRQDKELSESMANQPFDDAVAKVLEGCYQLYNIESSPDIMELARMTAGDLRQFVKEYKEGRARKFSFATAPKCQGCLKGLPDVKARVIKSASETIEANLCHECSINLSKEL